MPRMHALSSYATTIGVVDGETRITYHNTVIVRFTDKSITLDTGGWDTVTTRRKMNQASNQFGLGFSVGRVAGVTFLRKPDGSEIVMGRQVTFDRV